MIYRLPLIW